MTGRRVPRHGRIACKLHRDAAFRRLSAPAPNAQSLLLYLLSSEEATSIPGLVRAGVATLAENLGWSPRAVERHLDELAAAGFLERDQAHRLIWMRGQLDTTPPTSPKQVVAWARTLLEYRGSRVFDVVREAIESTVHVDGSGLGKAWAAEFRSAAPASPNPLPSALPKDLGRVLLTTDTETDTDDSLPSQSSTSSVQSPASPDLHGWRIAAIELLELWSTVGPPGPRPVFDGLTPESRRKLRDALAAKPLATWEAIFARAARSDYLAGRGEYPPITLWKALAWADRIEAGEFDTRVRQEPAAAPSAQLPVWTTEDDARVLEEQRTAAEVLAARHARGELPLSEQIRQKSAQRESARAAEEIRQRAIDLATDRQPARSARSA